MRDLRQGCRKEPLCHSEQSRGISYYCLCAVESAVSADKDCAEDSARYSNLWCSRPSGLATQTTWELRLPFPLVTSEKLSHETQTSRKEIQTCFLPCASFNHLTRIRICITWPD